MKKKKKSTKFARKFAEGEWVYDKYVDKKYRYKHSRDQLAGSRLVKATSIK